MALHSHSHSYENLRSNRSIQIRIFVTIAMVSHVLLNDRARDSSVGIAAGARFSAGAGDCFTIALRPALGPPNLLANGDRRLLPPEESDLGVKTTTHLRLVPRSRMVELCFHSPICLHGIALN
jgi:hypothetical protein